MTSKKVSQLLIDLGVARSHSRPQVSNDNPYSEANFKTMKYMSDFPGPVRASKTPERSAPVLRPLQPRTPAFGHRLHTPASVHYGTAKEVRDQRAVTLAAAYAANPARFRHRPPAPPKLPTIAWINEPTPEALIKSA